MSTHQIEPDRDTRDDCDFWGLNHTQRRRHAERIFDRRWRHEYRPDHSLRYRLLSLALTLIIIIAGFAIAWRWA